jgi:ABC-type transporter Mla MlaB component
VRPGPNEHGGLVLVFSGTIAREDIAALCRRLHELLEITDAPTLLCDVNRVSDPDGVAVDALARFQLTARRLGREIRVVHASKELRDLIELMGLTAVLCPCVESDLETKGQPE